MALRVVIADDEPLARSRLRALLADHADVEVAAEAEDAPGALQAVREHRPDLALLDVEMPGATGVELARRLQSMTPAPLVVFVTAHAAHAVHAFETGAVDYLLKPFDEARLATSLARARAALAARRALAGAEPAYLERVAVSLGKRTILVAVAAVDWLAASGNYVELHAGPEVHLVRATLAALADRLDPRAFVRIHRSYVVRLAAVKELRSDGPGELRAVLVGGVELPVSPRFRDRLPRA